MVLPHVHVEMTDAAPKPLRYDLAGFAGCSGYQPFLFGGRICDAGMGFEQSKSAKSVARNRMENRLRLHGPTTSASDLRHLFVELCFERGASETAPLLGDVVLLTEMTEDFRALGHREAVVRELLVSTLRAHLLQPRTWKEPRWIGMLPTWRSVVSHEHELSECLKHAYHIPLNVSEWRERRWV